MAQRSKAACLKVSHPLITAVAAVTLVGLAGCSTIGSVLEPDRIDYKSAGKAPSLEIPPDLTQLQRDSRYALPESSKGTATASGYAGQQTAIAPGASVAVATVNPDIRVERAGTQRWLVINQSPEVLWPELKDFWQDMGFLIDLEQPDAGIMETDWAENRAKIPQDLIRRTIGKALDSLYSTGERDKFRTRLERTASGGTEIFISHRGVQEELVGQDKATTVWTPRPSDPELEAEFLSRLAVRLSKEEQAESARSAVMNAEPRAKRAQLVQTPNGAYVAVDESFDRAWRRVGLALDRVGFTVEDRDRSKGLYFVRYVDQGEDAQDSSKKGFLSRVFSFGSKDKQQLQAERYQVAVREEGGATRVMVLNKDGQVEQSRTAEQILKLLNDQLK